MDEKPLSFYSTFYTSVKEIQKRNLLFEVRLRFFAGWDNAVLSKIGAICWTTVQYLWTTNYLIIKWHLIFTFIIVIQISYWGMVRTNSSEFRSNVILDLISKIGTIFVLIIIYLAFKMLQNISLKFSSKRINIKWLIL